MEKIIGRVVLIWIFIISGFIGVFISNNSDNQLFRFGPNPDLIIMGISIDTREKYVSVVSFCFVNSGVRCMNHNILQSWIINTVQDKTVAHVNPRQSYEISFISTIFNWFDFFMYMNILMSQFDMLLIETFADLIMTAILTSYYLRLKQKVVVTDENTPLIAY